MAALQSMSLTAILEIAIREAAINGVCMLILDYKLRTNQAQQRALDEAIRTTQLKPCGSGWMGMA